MKPSRWFSAISQLPRRNAGLVAMIVLVVAGSCLALWRRSVERSERFLAEARQRRDPTDIPATVAAMQRLDETRIADVRCVGPSQQTHDAVLAPGGDLLVASGGGLLRYRDASLGALQAAATTPGADREPQLLTHLDGLPALDFSAAGRVGERMLFGDRHGGLLFFDGERIAPVHLALGRSAPILDIAVQGEVAYLLASNYGVIAFDGRRARNVGAAANGSLGEASALCVGASGLVVGTRQGHLYRETTAAQAKLVTSALTEPLPITALACPSSPGGDLYVGTPLGVWRSSSAAGQPAPATPLRRNLFVTSLLETPAGLLVATIDDGVRVLDPVTGHERTHHLAGQPIERLRRLGDAPGRSLDDHVLVLGPRGAHVLTGGSAVALAPPALPGLAGDQVTAIVRDTSGTLWIGTFEHGVDLRDPATLAPRHTGPLATGSDARDRQINALLMRPRAREVLAATVRGVTRFSAGGHRAEPLDLNEGKLARDGVNALIELPAGLALATAHGLLLVDGARRRALTTFHGLASDHLYALAQDGLGRLVIGTLAGISVAELSEKPRVVFSIGAGPRALGAAWVTALAAAPEGVYVGTYGGGVSRLRRDGIVEDLGIPILRVHVNPGALVVDRGWVWIGTLDAGLLAFDSTTHRWSRLERLLPPGGVTALLVDGDTFFLGTPSGLVRASRTAVLAALLPLASPNAP